MEEHLKNRPSKKVYPSKKIIALRNITVKKLKTKLLPDENILKIILIGSSIKNTFGEYSPPGFRGSLYSDFDFIVFVKDDYKFPKLLDKEPSAKPFPDEKLNLAYRNKKFIENKYDIEVFFIREKNMTDATYQKLAEEAGIPMTPESKNKHLVIYQKS